jgi:L-galactose dehydrogenase
MRYRTLGKTGVSVSTIGFGGSPLGNVFKPVSAAGDSRLISTAIDKGINFFDVSPYYGLGLAEQRLGDALKPHRQNVFLATKCGRYGAEEFDFSRAGITAKVESSLCRLKTDAVDLLQVHDIEFADIGQILEETLPALAELKRQGKTRFIGITGYWPGLLATVLRECPLDTVLNYCHWNLFTDDMDIALTPATRLTGAALINASPLHMGLLSEDPIPDWHPAPESVRRVARETIRLCRTRNVDPATLAVWQCLGHPEASSTLVGVADLSQLESSCAALEFQPDQELLDEVTAVISPAFNTVWPQGKLQSQEVARNEGFLAGAAE